MFGIVNPRGDGYTSEFISEFEASKMAEDGFLVFYISKFNEADSFLRSFYNKKEN